jgi:hypothetical protein
MQGQGVRFRVGVFILHKGTYMTGIEAKSPSTSYVKGALSW